MKYSLVLATVGRCEELTRFLNSLEARREASFEVIVVDQNPDDRLAALLESFSVRFPLIHLRSARGLSRARNAGLRHVTGDVVAFPDDDCWYPSDLLERITGWFGEHPGLDGLSAISRDSRGRLSGCHWDRQGGIINRANVWRRAISSSIFMRRRLVEAVGDFDVNLGLGSGTPYGSGEETEYLIRALDYGFRLQYVPSLSVFHDQPALDSGATARGYDYGFGFGHVQRKYKYPFPTVFYYWVRAAGGVAVSVVKREPQMAKLHWENLKGRVAGWFH